MTTTTPPGSIPGAVRRAHLLWLLAVTAGVYETGLAIAHGFAEHDLTVPALVLGGLGVASLLIGPVGWLAAGNGPGDLDLAPLEWVFAASRVVHVAAVLAATASMFTPEARAYFGHADRLRSRPAVSSVPAAMIGSGR
jgi:hypothetical protein